MKRLKIISVLLSVSMCFSMLMTPLRVRADETEQTAETTETAETKAPAETTAHKAPKETEPSVQNKEKEETEPSEETTAPEATEATKQSETSKETEAPKESEATEETVATEETAQTADPKSGPEQTDKKTKKGAVAHSGSFDNITWSLDDDGTLTVSGGINVMLSNGKYPWLDYKSEIKKVVFEKPVAVIGPSSFKDCTNLTEIVFNDKISSIGSSAFSGCSNLADITLPDSLDGLGSYAFSGCEKLTKVVIPSGITILNGAMFKNCKNLKEVSLPSGLKEISGEAFLGCENLESISIPDKVERIGSDTFSDCKKLKEVNLPDKLITLGSSVFSSCSSLEEITIPSTVTYIGYSAFYGCTALKDITIPSGVTKLQHDIFYKCENLESVVLPSELTAIDSYAFCGCKKLKSIEIPESVTTISSNAFQKCESLESIKIPKCVTTISRNLFSGCTSLKTVSFSGSVTDIGVSAFENTNISSFAIPDGITNISASVFAGCKNLTTISIPKSVTKISAKAFNDCTSLSVVNYAGSEETWKNITIASNNDPILGATINCAENNTDSFSIKVNSGTSDCSSATLNKTVTITADAAPEGKGFFEWRVVKGNVPLDDPNSPVTTFQMPGEDVELTATYKDLHTVTVISGTADKTSAIEGQKIKLAAEANTESKVFYKWEVVKGNVEIDYPYSPHSATFLMLDEDVEIKAVYKYRHKVSVISGTADTTYELKGNKVYITADTAPEGKVFDKWEVVKGNVEINVVTSSKTNFIMPDEDVEIKATYINIITASGTCGTDITWTLNYNGVLKIIGSGPMYNGQAYGWENYKSKIRIIDVGDGVTSIGNSAFAGFDMELLQMPQTLTSIGDGAVKDCNYLSNLYFYGSSEEWLKVVIGKDNDPLYENVMPCGKDNVNVYPITVTSGTADKTRALLGDTIAITADAAPDGKEFDKWKVVKGYISITDENSSSTTFKITSNGVIKIQAIYKAIPTFDVTLIKEGNGTVEATPDKGKTGTQITIKATPDNGYYFKEWQVTDGGVTLDDPNSATTTFVMGSSNVSVKAVFEEIVQAAIGDTFEVSDYEYSIIKNAIDGTGNVIFTGLSANANPVTTLSLPATVQDKGITYNVTGIGANAMKDNTTVKIVAIGSKIVAIGNNAFFGCKNLVKVSGGAGLKTIGQNAFARCPKLATFVITSKVLYKIGPQAFYKDSRLKTVCVRNTTKLTKGGVKKSLKGSSVKTVRVKKSKVKKFKKYFTKKNCGRKVKVKK